VGVLILHVLLDMPVQEGVTVSRLEELNEALVKMESLAEAIRSELDRINRIFTKASLKGVEAPVLAERNSSFNGFLFKLGELRELVSFFRRLAEC